MLNVTLAQAVKGYRLHQNHRLSPTTMERYVRIFEDFIEHQGTDKPFNDITPNDIAEFFAANSHLSNRTLLNYHTSLSSLWTWSLKRKPPLAETHILHQVARPKPEERVISPFTQRELEKILRYVKNHQPYGPGYTKGSPTSVSLALRNRAIILLLLDTGLRASEICSLKIGHVDLANTRTRVLGKGSKERLIRFSETTGSAIWDYLTTRKDAKGSHYLFTTVNRRPFSRTTLYHLLRDIGDHANVVSVHPHRFRHTFAIQFLRNGGDIYSLQAMLGHSDLDTAKHYLRLAQVDLDQAHRKASPVTNWDL